MSTELSYDQLEFFYENAVVEDTNTSTQINRYRTLISKLKAKSIKLDEHIKNLNKIVDDLTLKGSNMSANIGTNNSLTQVRAIDRLQYIETNSVLYNYHLTYYKDVNYY